MSLRIAARSFLAGSPEIAHGKDEIMFGAPKHVVDRLTTEYPAGTRVELLEMDDFQAPPIGTKGTVTGVDDTASIMVKWDNGSRLNVVYGIDHIRKL